MKVYKYHHILPALIRDANNCGKDGMPEEFSAYAQTLRDIVQHI